MFEHLYVKQRPARPARPNDLVRLTKRGARMLAKRERRAKR